MGSLNVAVDQDIAILIYVSYSLQQADAQFGVATQKQYLIHLQTKYKSKQRSANIKFF